MPRRDHDPHEPDPPEREERPGADDGPGRRTWLVSIAVVLLLVGLYFVWPAYEWVIDRTYVLVRSGDQAELRAWVERFGAWGPLLILGLMLAQTLLPVIPSILVMVVAVLAYGPWWGGALAWGGLMLSGTVAYTIGRALGASVVDRLIGSRAERRIAGYVERHGVLAVIAARVSPALSTDAVSYAAGIVRMNAPSFLAATAVGILPLVVLIGWLGASIERLSTTLLWVSIASVALLVAWVVVDRIRHGRPEPGERSAA